MTPAFADTFYYLALLSRSDEDRQRAIQAAQRLTGPMVTTPWILTEVADAMAHPKHRALFLQFLDVIKSDRGTTVVSASDELFERSLEFYAERPDKDWPLTDCISFVIMQEMGITDALTADHHFEQAGFVALLK